MYLSHFYEKEILQAACKANVYPIRYTLELVGTFSNIVKIEQEKFHYIPCSMYQLAILHF